MPATPYVSAAAFRAHPTYLDTDGLIPDNPDPNVQTAELTSLLLQASAWADNECDQPLGARLYTQSTRVCADRAGLLHIHADRKPVRTVTSVAYGASPTTLTTLSSPQVWVEDDANMVVTLGGTSTAWAGSLQVGFGAAPGGDIFTRLGIVAGYVATLTAAGATAGDTSITVADPTGIEPGGQYTIWEPGRLETVTVSPLWQPPTPATVPAATSVLLADALTHDHDTGHDFSGLPAEARLAIVKYTIALLLRPDTSAESEFPDSTTTSSTRAKDPQRTGLGYVDEARKILCSYQRVR